MKRALEEDNAKEKKNIGSHSKCVCVFGTNECLIQKWHQYPILTLGYWLPKMRLGSLSQPLAIRNIDFHHTVARRLKQKSRLMERKTHLLNLFHACDLIDIHFHT